MHSPLVFVGLILSEGSFAFQACNVGRITSRTYGSVDSSDLDPALIQRAEEPLPWESIYERESKAVLDLSRWKKTDPSLSLSEDSLVNRQTTSKETIDDGDTFVDTMKHMWKQGVVWEQNRRILMDASIISSYDRTESKEDEKSLLEVAPQLVRIPPDDIKATLNAAFALGVSAPLLQSEPVVLTFPAEYLTLEALDYLSNMMMLGGRDAALALCKGTPKLLTVAVEGYMHECSVKNALGDASDAVYRAGKTVASDLGDQLRVRRKQGMGEP